MAEAPLRTPPQDLADVEQVLDQFERIETQLQQIREGLTHSHRLTTLGTIASVIAHEFNNILTPMISYAQLALARSDDSALMKKAVEKALAGAERAAHISSSLLGFVREGDEQQVAFVPAVVDQTLACLARDPAKDRIKLILDVPRVKVAMSPLQLQQVLLNLILNARKAMCQAGGQLKLTGRVDEEQVELVVSDTGPGIPAEIRDRLFEPFATHQIGPEATSATTTGTGLGLCICQDLLRSAGGSISADSESSSGRGATFRLTIPKADEPVEST